MPSTTVSTQPVFRNTGAGLLGGAMTGANIANMIPGLGTGIGAIGGGLLGGVFLMVAKALQNRGLIPNSALDVTMNVYHL
ncbi:MAG: hypothetical protein CM15mV95_230 [Caudoviricetes sp.]|nr:MAG: hypothetical protein CM15mV95_230 [Caudoviricetes sp.]